MIESMIGNITADGLTRRTGSKATLMMQLVHALRDEDNLKMMILANCVQQVQVIFKDRLQKT